MGTVWRAIQLSTGREVALKILNGQSLASDIAKTRFEREVTLSAQIDHPNIARVFDAGNHRGVYFYAMELIDGKHLDEFVKSAALPQSGLLELLQKLCEAIQHAHQRGIIHRDLKPSNIIVTDDGQPHVLDFGLARSLDNELPSSVTIEGIAVGTPAFMAPEQANGDVLLDTSVDVYALGAIAYSLLTGETAHVLDGSRLDVLNRIAIGEAMNRSKMSSLNSDIRAMLGKAMAFSPGDRYGSAGGFAADITRYLKHEPLVAKNPTKLYRLKKFARKHYLGISVSFALLAIITAVIWVAFLRVTMEVNETKDKLADSWISGGDLSAETLQWRGAKKLFHDAKNVKVELGRSTAAVDLALWNSHRWSPKPVMSFVLDGKPVTVAPANDGRRVYFATGQSISEWDVLIGKKYRTWSIPSGQILCMAMNAKGDTLAIGSNDGKVRLWELEKEQPADALKIHDASVDALAFAPNGLALYSGGTDKTIHGLNLSTGNVAITIKTLEDQGAPTTLYIFPDNLHVAATDTKGHLIGWEVITGSQVAMHSNGPPAVVAFRRDGQKLFASFNSDTFFREWQTNPLKGKSTTSRAHDSPIVALRLSDDQGLIAAVTEERQIRSWPTHNLVNIQTYTDHDHAITASHFLKHHRVLVSAQDDGKVYVWPSEPVDVGDSFRPVHTYDATVSPDGKLLAVIEADQRPATIWDIQSGMRLIELSGLESVKMGSICFSSDSKHVFCTMNQGDIHIWDLAKRQRIQTIQNVSISSVGMKTRIARHASLAVTCSNGGSFKVWDTRKWFNTQSPTTVAGPPIATRELGVDIFCTAISSDGMRVAAGAGDGRVFFWDYGISNEPVEWIVSKKSIDALAFTPDGKRLFAGGRDCELNYLDCDTGKVIHQWTDHRWRIHEIEVSPDGKTVVSADHNGYLLFWDIETRKLIRRLRHYGSEVFSVNLANNFDHCIVSSLGMTSRWQFSFANQYADNYAKARSAATTIGVNSDDVSALNELASWYQSNGIWRWADELYQQASQVGSDINWMDAGRMACRMENWSGALSCFEQAKARGLGDQWHIDLFITAVEKRIADESSP